MKKVKKAERRKVKKAEGKIKEISLKMRFNPGTLTFEPVLPDVLQNKEKDKRKK